MFVKVFTKKLLLAIGILSFVACSTTHTMYLNNGATIDTAGAPSLDEDTGFYAFEDLSGREGVIDQNQVSRIKKK